MINQEIEKLIFEIDHSSRDMCVCPENQTADCAWDDNRDCYTCRVAYFEKLRQLLQKEE